MPRSGAVQALTLPRQRREELGRYLMAPVES